MTLGNIVRLARQPTKNVLSDPISHHIANAITKYRLALYNDGRKMEGKNEIYIIHRV